MYHQRSIEDWFYEELSGIEVSDHYDTEIIQHLLTFATLVDFPQFPNIHHLIPQILDLRPKDMTKRYSYQIEDSDKWEIYVKYRKIVSQLLIDRPRSSVFYVVQKHYVDLAKYLLNFLSEGLG